MVDIQRILCPVDFSEASQHALEHAVVLAKWYDSRITALHLVHVPLVPQPPIFVAGFAEATAPAVPNRKARQAELEAWLEPAHRVGIKTDAMIDDGDAATRILEHASALPADLIVMGTHGLGGFERFMVGSVTEKVLRKATCPVMTVPPGAVTAAKVPYTRLLCPVDFSDSSSSALRFAFSLAEEADAKLTILHVVDWPDDGLLTQRFDEPEFRRAVEDEARRRLEALVTGDVRVWCKPTTTVAYGKPYREILQTAESEGTDLIVIGLRGRNALDLTVFGSTTNQVVRRAPCPVLTMKH
jgi:nucleotide-binding universal stress UspA family protein